MYESSILLFYSHFGVKVFTCRELLFKEVLLIISDVSEFSSLVDPSHPLQRVRSVVNQWEGELRSTDQLESELRSTDQSESKLRSVHQLELDFITTNTWERRLMTNNQWEQEQKSSDRWEQERRSTDQSEAKQRSSDQWEDHMLHTGLPRLPEILESALLGNTRYSTVHEQ